MLYLFLKRPYGSADTTSLKPGVSNHAVQGDERPIYSREVHFCWSGDIPLLQDEDPLANRQ